jgi:hypothetical protein
MSNFHKTNNLPTNNNTSKPSPQIIQKDTISKPVKQVTPPSLNTMHASNRAASNRETNQSALRHSVKASSRHSQLAGDTMASRTGQNVIGQTPKSKRSSVASSVRMIRTGAFQRIKA